MLISHGDDQYVWKYHVHEKRIYKVPFVYAGGRGGEIVWGEGREGRQAVPGVGTIKSHVKK